MVRATPTAVQVEGSITRYHLNHCTRVPKRRTERERNRQADNSGERDKEKQETQDEVQTEDSQGKDSQGTHILLSDEEERRENKSDNIPEDHYMIILRTLIVNATVKQIEMINVPNNRQMITEENLDEYYEGWLNKLNLNEQTLDDSSSNYDEDEEEV